MVLQEDEFTGFALYFFTPVDACYFRASIPLGENASITEASETTLEITITGQGTNGDIYSIMNFVLTINDTGTSNSYSHFLTQTTESFDSNDVSLGPPGTVLYVPSTVDFLSVIDLCNND